MVDENDAQKSVEEPIAISENGEAVVTSWDMLVNLCKNESLKKKVETLRLRVSDEKKDEPLEELVSKLNLKYSFENDLQGLPRYLFIFK